MSGSKEYDNLTVQEYVGTILEQAPREIRDDPNLRAELIEHASAEYIVYADKENVQEHEYHYLSLVRVKRLLHSAQQTYEDQTEELLELAEKHDNEAYLRELADSAGRYSVGNTYLALYSLAFETMKDLIERLLPRILENGLNESVSDTLLSQVGHYSARADLLNKADIISDETRDGIRDIGEIRRDLVHDVDERFFLTFLDESGDSEYIMQTLNELYELVYDESLYVSPDDTIL